MSALTWEQKLDALQGLGQCSLHMRKPGDWYVVIPVRICDGHLESGVSQSGATPERAVEECWRQVTEELPAGSVLRLKTGTLTVRWNGYMWVTAELAGAR